MLSKVHKVLAGFTLQYLDDHIMPSRFLETAQIGPFQGCRAQMTRLGRVLGNAMQVEALTAKNAARQSQTARQRSTQASEVKNLELAQRELNGRLEDLADEKKLLQEQLSKANLAASDPDISMLRCGMMHCCERQHLLMHRDLASQGNLHICERL